jgi:hypothetical protein
LASKIKLPSKSSVKKWRPFSFIDAGKVDELKQVLIKVAEKLSSTDKDIILLFDEISITQRWEYDEKLDKCIGEYF